MSYIGNNITVSQYTPQIAYFNGNGSTTAFTLPQAVVSSAQIIVTVDNVIQNPSSAYTVSGTTLTFTSAPLSGTNNIWVEYNSLQTQLIAPSQGTVGTAQLVNNTVVTTADATINGLTVGKGGGSVASNTALGLNTFSANTTGTYNTAIGHQAGNANSTGSFGTYVGYGAGKVTTVGGNTFLGTIAGFSNTTGVSNTFVGSLDGGSNGVGQSNTTGSYNTALGGAALYSNTTASNNTAVGYQAGYSNTTGANNAYFGYQAGYSNTINSSNTYIGYYAGQSTTGLNNTFVGYASGYLVTSGTRNSILGVYNGNQGGLDIRTASNYIVLSDGDGNPRMYSNSSGNWTSGGSITAPNTAKAWVSYNGATQTIRSSFNVSSVTYNGTGYYTINYTSAMPNANYAAVASCQDPGGAAAWIMINDDGAFGTTNQTTTAISIGVVFYNYTYKNPNYVSVAIFGA